MNSFFASVEQQENPKFAGKPLIVAPMLTDSTCAISASYEARSLGIKTGTMVRDARLICPQIIVVPAHPKKYIEYHDKIVEVLEHYFATIHVLSVDEMACILGHRHLNSPMAIELAQKIKLHMSRSLGEHLRCSIGIGPNIFLAKVASDFQKPNGLTVFEGDYTPLLFKLNLMDLPGIGRKMLLRLNDHNINTVADLWSATSKKLRLVWGGVIGERWYYMLRGSIETDYGTLGSEDKKSVSQSHVLPPQFRTPQGARDIILRLSSKALKRLRSYELEAKVIWIGVVYQNRFEFKKRFKWQTTKAQHIATNDDLFWLPLIEECCKTLPQLDDWIPLKALICFHELARHSTQQAFFVEDRSKFIKLFTLIDRLNEVYGYSTDLARVFHLKKEAPMRISFGKPKM